MKQNIMKYFLILGRACNMQCTYCIQGQEKPVLHFDEQMPDPKEIVRFFPEKGKYTLVLYGGEPMIYWDFVVKFSDLMRERNPDAIISMTTNGTLLTVERAKILNELGVNVTLSHDGHKFEITRKHTDFLKTDPEPFLTLNKRSVAAVYSSLNPNFYDVWDYFDLFKIRHGLEKREKVIIRAIKDAGGTTAKEMFIYNNPEWEQMLDKVFDKLYKDLMGGTTDSFEFMNYENALKTLNYRVNFPSDDPGPWCGSDSYICQIDLKGNMFSCLNGTTPFGNFYDIGPNVGPRSKYRDNEKCKACPCYIYCGGGCFSTAESHREYVCYCVYQETVRLLETIIKAGGVKYE